MFPHFQELGKLKNMIFFKGANGFKFYKETFPGHCVSWTWHVVLQFSSSEYRDLFTVRWCTRDTAILTT